MGDHRIVCFYVVCDVSASMAHGGRIAALNAAVSQLRDEIAANPVVADLARLSLIDFATESRLVLPLCDLAMVDDLPTLAPRGLTSYVAAIDKVVTTIRADVTQLIEDELSVYRPVVFFFSDGDPTDDRHGLAAAIARLHDPAWEHRPDVVSFGVGECTPAYLARVATTRCFVASDPDHVTEAISGIGDYLVRSVVASGAAGVPTLPVDVPDWLDEHDLDLL